MDNYVIPKQQMDELLSAWRGMKSPLDPFTQSASDCADDLQVLLEKNGAYLRAGAPVRYQPHVDSRASQPA